MRCGRAVEALLTSPAGEVRSILQLLVGRLVAVRNFFPTIGNPIFQ